MRRTSSWATVGLAVLVVLALVLVFAALRSTRGTVTPEPLASALTTPSDKPTKDERDPGLADALPDTIEPPLLMVTESLAYRAQVGSCLGGTTLERSTDGGQRWKDVPSPASATLSLASAGGDAIDIVGADEQCDVLVWASTDRGASWFEPAVASDVFARVPGDPTKLSTPSGDAKNPCPVRSEAPVALEQITDADAALLCRSGEVFTTSDGGVKWRSQMPVIGGQALAFDTPDYGWALQRDSGNCAGYQLLGTQDGGASWQTGGCVGTEQLPDERQLPSLSFVDAQTGMADVGGEVVVTFDAGLTWREPR